MYRGRYVYDALYGPMFFPSFVWRVISCPELQRLREVRLCNTNSLTLTGGANINRYEHALGTAFLALKCLEAWPFGVDRVTRDRIVLAALLHDIGSAAFGHSTQYVIGRKGYEHESFYEITNPSTEASAGKYAYRRAHTEPIYFGMPRRLASLITEQDLREISLLVSGEGPYGPLISAGIDLDNIDNVYRLAYHIGIVDSGSTALMLSQAVRAEAGALVVEDSAVPLVEEWYQVRRNLYSLLLLNPDEFSTKCMLQEALEIAQERSSALFSWSDVDYSLLQKLSKSSDDVAEIVSRLMIGDLYGCLGIFSTSKITSFEVFADPAKRRELEGAITDSIRQLGPDSLKKTVVRLHAIKDVNKTRRRITMSTTQGREVTVGVPTRRILIGGFFKNVRLSMAGVEEDFLVKWRVREIVRAHLGRATGDHAIEELDPYDEVSAGLRDSRP